MNVSEETHGFSSYLSRLKSARQVKTLSAVSTLFSGSIATKVPNVARVTMMDTLSRVARLQTFYL